MAPQSKDAAPGPSSASLEPRASGLGLHSDLRDDEFASPRDNLDKGDQHVEVRHRLPLRIKNDFGAVGECSHSDLSTSEKSMISVAPV